jgi:hypothetical protein
VKADPFVNGFSGTREKLLPMVLPRRPDPLLFELANRVGAGVVFGAGSEGHR